VDRPVTVFILAKVQWERRTSVLICEFQIFLEILISDVFDKTLDSTKRLEVKVTVAQLADLG
jgi:hypothetical protein